MSSKAAKCEKGKDPKTCSPRQIEECHGKGAVHPCESDSKPSRR